MKAIARTSLLTTGLLTLATSAFAAGSASGGSGLLVWLFLGFFYRFLPHNWLRWLSAWLCS